MVIDGSPDPETVYDTFISKIGRFLKNDYFGISVPEDSPIFSEPLVFVFYL